MRPTLLPYKSNLSR